MLRPWLRPKELMPYTIPKLTAFAFLLCKGVTSSKGVWKTLEAVILWMSLFSL